MLKLRNTPCCVADIVSNVANLNFYISIFKNANVAMLHLEIEDHSLRVCILYCSCVLPNSIVFGGCTNEGFMSGI